MLWKRTYCFISLNLNAPLTLKCIPGVLQFQSELLLFFSLLKNVSFGGNDFSSYFSHESVYSKTLHLFFITMQLFQDLSSKKLSKSRNIWYFGDIVIFFFILYTLKNKLFFSYFHVFKVTFIQSSYILFHSFL